MIRVCMGNVMAMHLLFHNVKKNSPGSRIPAKSNIFIILRLIIIISYSMKKALFFLFVICGFAPGMPDRAYGQTVVPKQALLIIDIQNDYFPGGANPLAGSPEASLKAKQVLEFFRSQSLPVIHIQHLSPYPGATFFIPGTQGAEIHENVFPAAGETVIIKHYPNAFRSTGLSEYLKVIGANDLIVCGMMTHMCVDATVRAAKDLGFGCTVIGDACATKDLDIQGVRVAAREVHYAFLAALDYYYANVVTSEDFMAKFPAKIVF